MLRQQSILAGLKHSSNVLPEKQIHDRQVPEKLIYEGEEHVPCSIPLHDYFLKTGTQPDFVSPRTGLRRGYIGTWKIVDGRLYLIGLHGTLAGGREASLATLFPDNPESVFADWYSGILRIPQGELLEYVHGGFASAFVRDLFIDIERGEVRKTYIQENDAPEVTDSLF